ncbi:smad nuclear interacting protein 1 [Linepithema humile]|uniref:smad nuclear interacting protein 1 n=1 Tax=Linepithema humile TaxID=83485 RepID=UPI0006238DD2|nr:PREDICTED: smad nuclear interacting protein 1 [Linepithema humile]
MSNWRASHSNNADRRDVTYKSNREDRCERSNDSYRDRSQRDRSREHRGSRRDHFRKDDEKQNGRRKYDRSPPRRENNYSRHRERNERSRSKERRDDSGRRRNDQYKQKRSPEDVRMKKEPSPEWGKSNVKNEDKSKQQEKEKPNFELSGKLTEDMNTVNGVVIKYAEPQDARKPKRRWRLYPFKGEKALPTLYIHRQSAYLMGRDRKVADIPLDHPSCSKQHAALQYRLVSFQKEGGVEGRRVRPYIIDLESANGTFVNNVKLEPRRYHELLEKDVIRFGFSTREYVLLHEHSKDDSFDDDVPLTNAT